MALLGHCTELVGEEEEDIEEEKEGEMAEVEEEEVEHCIRSLWFSSVVPSSASLATTNCPWNLSHHRSSSASSSLASMELILEYLGSASST